ncbi:lipopolysaccharide heptosyltransferase II [Salinivibrio kushneri]|uniref:lipopolysaccharide heptosyltransferase II n=1 Tax=Salinivibrio kushneri TaxID=1908198 RepID=A0AA47KKS7_9GAMM|nr:lipopolysaccharide heptosyltransferase II [Salinivibrio kushneri]WBA08796.1 lipopolysaccharide heptosyltransferase II [Salinivibrio kushneri]
MTRILIIGPSWVGDMVMSQSLYKTLKQQHPDAKIDVMAPAWCAPILARMPEVNRSIEMPLGHGELALGKRYQLGRRLAKHSYDRAYVLPNSAKSALIPWFAGIPTRIGWKGEMRYGLLNDLRPNKKAFQYMVERYVALAHPRTEMQSSASLGGLDSLPKPALDIDPDAQAAVIAKLGLNQDKPVIGLCPGAEFGPAKKWPEQHYAEVARQAHQHGYQIWLFGSAKDVETCEKIAALAENAPNIHVLAGKTNLIEAVDLLGTCQTVVSNDSGLMHIAAAVNCQVIAIYGSTSPDYTPPLTSKVDIVHTDIECRPCFQRECPLGHLKCLNDLAPSRVASLIKVGNNQ